VVTAAASRDRGTSHSRTPPSPKTGHSHIHPPRQRRQARRWPAPRPARRHRPHRLARQLRDLARADRRTRVIPARLRRAWHPVPRLRPHGW